MPVNTDLLAISDWRMEQLKTIGGGDALTGLDILLSKVPIKTDDADRMKETVTYINSQFVGDVSCKLPLVDIYRHYCEEVLEPLGKMKFKRVLQNNGFTVKTGAQNIVYLFYVDRAEDW